jgi:hypothetical protein
VTSRHGAVTAVSVHAWLASQHEAELGYSSGQGPRRLVVRYALCAERLVFRLPEYSCALGYAPNQPVTLTVAVHDQQGVGARHLVVSGTALPVADDSCADLEKLLDEQWPDGVATHLLALATSESQLVHAG